MGSSKSGSAPAEPNPAITAQIESNINRPDVFGPSGGGVQQGYTGPDGRFVPGPTPIGQRSAVRTVENPTQAAVRRVTEPAGAAVTARLIDDNMRLPAAPTVGALPDFGSDSIAMLRDSVIGDLPEQARVGDRGTVAQSIFDRNYSMMRPGIEQGQDRLLTNLQARGIPIGSEAFNEAYGAQTREVNDTIARLAMDADVAAGQEQSRQLSMDRLVRSDAVGEVDMFSRLMTSLRGAERSDQTAEFNLGATERDRALNELMQAIGGSFMPTEPLPNNTGAPINYSGMVDNQYRSRLAQHQADQAGDNALMGTIGSLGAAAILMSSSRFKTVEGQVDVESVLQALMRVPVYGWTYLERFRPPEDDGEQHFGPLAEHMKEALGIGKDTHIHLGDMCGALLAMSQAIAMRLHVLERRMAAANNDVLEFAGSSVELH
ncbi:MAG: tail fiber domain-containing protein [Pseudomonadota bacterium]